MLRLLPLLQGGLLEIPQDLVLPSQTMWTSMMMMILKKMRRNCPSAQVCMINYNDKLNQAFDKENLQKMLPLLVPPLGRHYDRAYRIYTLEPHLPRLALNTRRSSFAGHILRNFCQSFVFEVLENLWTTKLKGVEIWEYLSCSAADALKMILFKPDIVCKLYH